MCYTKRKRVIFIGNRISKLLSKQLNCYNANYNIILLFLLQFIFLLRQSYCSFHYMKYKNFVKLTLLALSSLSNLCTGAVSPALPLIQKDLEANGAVDIGMIVKMMVVMPNVFIAVFAPIFGCFADKISNCF